MKYLASDLDGTLLNEEHGISEENIKGIIEFKKAGNKFIISTGRSLASIYDLFSDYPEIEYDYIVACNGAIVLDKDKNIIHSKSVRNDIAEDIFKEFIDNEDVCVHFESEGEHYLVDSNIPDLESVSQEMRDLYNHFKYRVSKEELFNNVSEREYSIISLFSKNADKHVAEKAKNILLDKFGDSLEAFRNQFFVDIAPKDCTKGNGLKKILELNNVNEDKLYAIGDSFNDISMFNLTENSFTFHYAEDGVKEIANNHVSSVEECIKKIMN
ncbi:Cof-type HAD-IIB family hydrolase [Clostridium tertium]|uniref:Phosphatase YwpJ n=1 Tax=Clostridium tertium TaxID=1559 RepID=A0A6N3C8W5_9CLOT